MSVAELVARRPARFTATDRLKNIGAERSEPFLASLADDPAYARNFIAEAGALKELDRTDGIRMLLANGDTIQFRASGNAPDLRCCTETDDAA